MRTVIITGMSGAGKSTAIHILEDIGYYCVDNIPPTLISEFVLLCRNADFTGDNIAFVADARSGELITHLADEIDRFRKDGNTCTVLFLDADDTAITKRYKETRRRHPHAEEGRIEDGIFKERKLLSEIRARADYVLDTSGLLTKALREKMVTFFSPAEPKCEPISVNVVSFGFKRGIPLDCDLMFDVRFLPNPFYDERLKVLTGKDKRVSDYALSCSVGETFLEKLEQMLLFLLPQYILEGKSALVIGIGCTGGKHRSVAVAEHLGKFLSQNNYLAYVNHRDIGAE